MMEPLANASDNDNDNDNEKDERKQTSVPIADFSARYLSFLEHAFNPANGRFRNFLGYDRSGTNL